MSTEVGFFGTLLETLKDVLPIAGILFAFQVFVLRRRVLQARRVRSGSCMYCSA